LYFFNTSLTLLRNLSGYLYIQTFFMLNTSTNRKIFQNLPDESRCFPQPAFDLLRELGLLTINLPPQNNKKLAKKGELNYLLHNLRRVGRADLSVGRIYEGHLNGIELIKIYGTNAQKKFYFEEVRNGKLFSVWNTELPEESIQIREKEEAYILEGAKVFCSGSLNIDYALLTAYQKKTPQLLIVPIKKNTDLKADWSLWNPMGMKASVSSRIDFTGIKVNTNQLLGIPGDYLKEPAFSGGAIRFAAVQLGGAEAIFRESVQHLKKVQRAGDPHQQKRIGKMATLIKSGKLWLDGATEMEGSTPKDVEKTVNYANMARSAIGSICQDVMLLAERSVGLQGYMQGHPLEKLHRDLSTYLKQPGPDLALMRVGGYAATHCSL